MTLIHSLPGEARAETQARPESLISHEAAQLGTAMSCVMASLALPSFYTTPSFILIVVFQPALLGLLLIGLDSCVPPGHRTSLALLRREGFYCLMLSVGIAQALGSRRRGHDRDEKIQNNFNSLPAPEAHGYSP